MLLLCAVTCECRTHITRAIWAVPGRRFMTPPTDWIQTTSSIEACFQGWPRMSAKPPNPNPNPNPITLTLARPARRAADQCGPRKDGPRLAQGGLRVIARVRVRVRLELGLGLGLGLAWLGLGRTRTLSLSPPRSGQRRGDEGLMVEHTRDCARPRDGCLSARPVRRGKQIKYYVK